MIEHDAPDLVACERVSMRVAILLIGGASLGMWWAIVEMVIG